MGARTAGTAAAAPDWGRWDAAVSARMPSAALRAASRTQGAALLRTVTLAFPSPAVAALRALPRVHHPLVLGAAAAAAGADSAQAAALALHHLVGGASTAAVRLLGLDPLRVAAVTAAVARTAVPVAADAAALGSTAAAAGDPGLLPAEGSPLTDVLAELHRASEATLFAS
jgi:urease accessory protein